MKPEHPHECGFCSLDCHNGSALPVAWSHHGSWQRGARKTPSTRWRPGALLPGVQIIEDAAVHEQYSRVITPEPAMNEETEDVCALLQQCLDIRWAQTFTTPILNPKCIVPPAFLGSHDRQSAQPSVLWPLVAARLEAVKGGCSRCRPRKVWSALILVRAHPTMLWLGSLRWEYFGMLNSNKVLPPAQGEVAVQAGDAAAGPGGPARGRAPFADRAESLQVATAAEGRLRVRDGRRRHPGLRRPRARAGGVPAPGGLLRLLLGHALVHSFGAWASVSSVLHCFTLEASAMPLWRHAKHFRLQDPPLA